MEINKEAEKMPEAVAADNATAENGANDREALKQRREELMRQLREKAEAERKQLNEANEIWQEGKGRLRLEKPIRAGGKDIEELVYDFTALTGQEYIDVMDSDFNSNNAVRITYKQAIMLFATAAAKKTDKVDADDIIQQIGVSDAVAGEQLARLFFNASTRAGRLHISKM